MAKTKLNKQLRDWIKKKKAQLKEGAWVVKQSTKGKNGRLYTVGVVKDWVYAYGERDYLFMILKIRGDPDKKHGWRSSELVYKLYYMTTEAKKRNGETKLRVVNGQRPIVTHGYVFKRLMHKARRKKFF